MAQPNCIRCNSTRFELQEAEPAGSLHKMHLLQCAECGGVVGSVPYYDLAELIVNHNANMMELARGLGHPVEKPITEMRG